MRLRIKKGIKMKMRTLTMLMMALGRWCHFQCMENGKSLLFFFVVFVEKLWWNKWLHFTEWIASFFYKLWISSFFVIYYNVLVPLECQCSTRLVLKLYVTVTIYDIVEWLRVLVLKQLLLVIFSTYKITFQSLMLLMQLLLIIILIY